LIGFRGTILIICLLLSVQLAACDNEDSPTVQATAVVPAVGTGPAVSGNENGGVSTIVTPEPTPIPPTPTPSEPLAAMVNGSPIFLAEYENELARYQQAQSELDSPDIDYAELVLDSLVERELIIQAAAANGVFVTEEEVAAKVAELMEESGSEENFAAWLRTNQLSPEEFEEAISAELLTQKMIELITADVPTTAEQIHARSIRVDDPELAQSLLDQINSGSDFGELAKQYSLDSLSATAGGDMGFFSAGSLIVPELEAPAFSLQPGETSQVIPVTHFDGQPTYYLLQVIELDPERTLEGNQREVLLGQAITSWIAELRTQAEITIFVNLSA
jgi:parvulin-like peptidyl-prolyl isomerase